MDLLHTTFGEIAALLALVAAVGLLAQVLRQPLIVAFIVAGILAGPAGFGIARAAEPIELLADLGVAVLLFLVGLKLDLQLVQTLGGVALATGLGQVAFTSAIGAVLCLALGIPPLGSLYVAVALTFSSTIIIVKLLSDKREVDSLHGRIALGFLIVQDVVVVIAMFALSAMGVGESTSVGVGAIVLRGLSLVVGASVFGWFVAAPLFKRLSRTPELVVTAALGWAVLLAAVSDGWGFGKELGGLLAGVSLASTPVRDALASRLSGLRDFLLLFFFVELGAGLDLSLLGASVPAAVALSAFVLVGNPLIVMAIMGAMGYRSRTGFLAGLTVAQISEFSLVFVAMGARLGHVGEEIVGLVTLVGLVTIGLSTYLITWSHPLYARLEPLLGVFERRVPHREAAADVPGEARVDVVVLGLGRLGMRIAEQLAARGFSIFGVDFDPEALASWTARGRRGMYGDASDPELLSELPVASCVVVALPPVSGGIAGYDPRAAIVGSLRGAGFTGVVAVTGVAGADAAGMVELGADVILDPFAEAGARATEVVADRLAP